MTHTVLVVEDEQHLRKMMRDALELNGYAVVTAEHGEDALTKLAEIEHPWTFSCPSWTAGLS